MAPKYNNHLLYYLTVTYIIHLHVIIRMECKSKKLYNARNLLNTTKNTFIVCRSYIIRQLNILTDL